MRLPLLLVLDIDSRRLMADVDAQQRRSVEAFDG